MKNTQFRNHRSLKGTVRAKAGKASPSSLPVYVAEAVRFDDEIHLAAPGKKPWHAPVFTVYDVEMTQNGSKVGTDAHNKS